MAVAVAAVVVVVMEVHLGDCRISKETVSGEKGLYEEEARGTREKGLYVGEAIEKREEGKGRTHVSNTAAFKARSGSLAGRCTFQRTHAHAH